MFVVIGIMFFGVALGFLLKKMEWLQKISKGISVTIFLLLFLLGLSVGSNKEIVDNLATLGGQAFILAIMGSLGSAIAAWGVYRIFFAKKGGKK
ncbi:MAG: LysO family transporter [Bacteroidales bacterium]